MVGRLLTSRPPLSDCSETGRGAMNCQVLTSESSRFYILIPLAATRRGAARCRVYPLKRSAFEGFVLSHSGCVGRLRSGRIERDGPAGINVYNERAGTK